MRWAVWLRPSGRRVRVKSCELMSRAAPAARRAARNLASCGRVHLLGRFDLEIDDVAAGFGGFQQDFELGVEGAGEMAAKRLAAAGGDGGDVAAAVEKGLELGQGGGGLGQEVEAKLNENRVFNGGFGAGKELGGRGSLDSDAQLAHAQARHCSGAGAGVVSIGTGDGKRHFLQLTHIKGPLSLVATKNVATG